MKKSLIIASVLMCAAAAYAEDNVAVWNDAFKTLDTDGNGTISRTEWEAGWAKLKIDPVPTFTAMDTDSNNSIDPDEWTAASKMVKAFPVSCKSAKSSWCEKQY